MKRRGMDAVASKSARRAPVFLRKKAAKSEEMDAPPPPMPEKDDEDEPSEMTCPKCGMELADTEENRAYIKMRAEESDDEDMD